MKKLIFPSTVDLSWKNPAMITTFTSDLGQGTYPVVSFTKPKATRKSDKAAWFFAQVLAGSEEKRVLVYTGDPKVSGLMPDKEYSSVIVSEDKKVLFE